MNEALKYRGTTPEPEILRYLQIPHGTLFQKQIFCFRFVGNTCLKITKMHRKSSLKMTVCRQYVPAHEWSIAIPFHAARARNIDESADTSWHIVPEAIFCFRFIGNTCLEITKTHRKSTLNMTDRHQTTVSGCETRFLLVFDRTTEFGQVTWPNI